MIETSTRCACASFVVLRDQHGTWFATCPRCYDGDGDSDLELLCGRGATPEDALSDWVHQLLNAGLEPERADLANFVIPFGPEGYAFECAGLTFSSLALAEEWVASHSPSDITYGPLQACLASNDT